MASIVYEVNLEINEDAYEDVVTWLGSHIKEMVQPFTLYVALINIQLVLICGLQRQLTFNGFVSAELFQIKGLNC